jgi:hypothetical protein
MKTLAVLLVLAFAAQLSATTITVPTDQPTIQAGVDSAIEGDTVLLLPNTYTGDGNHNLNFGGKEIVLLGSAGAANTIIWCGASNAADDINGILLNSGESAATILQDLTIRRAVIGVEATDGATPTCRGMVLDSCYRFGIRVAGGAVDIYDCAFSFCYRGLTVESSGTLCNSSTFYGNTYGIESAMFIANPNAVTVDSCYFSNNGGAARGNFTMRNCTISGGYGGIFGHPDQSEQAFVADHCLIENLISAAIGVHSQSTVTNTIIRDNGSVAIRGTQEGLPSLTLDHCTITGNGDGITSEGHLYMHNCLYACNGDGVYVTPYYGNHGDIEIEACTFADNRGDALTFSVYPENSCVIESTIVASSGGTGVTIYNNGGPLSIECCDVFGNGSGNYGMISDQTGVNGNISVPPLFCDTAAGDYHLRPDSPCLPANNSCGVLMGVLSEGCSFECGDFNGDTRINLADAIYLLAYIFGSGLPPADVSSGNVNCDDRVNLTDVVAMVYYIFYSGPAPCEGCDT